MNVCLLLGLQIIDKVQRFNVVLRNDVTVSECVGFVQDDVEEEVENFLQLGASGGLSGKEQVTSSAAVENHSIGCNRRFEGEQAE